MDDGDDVNVTAARIVAAATAETPEPEGDAVSQTSTALTADGKNAAAVALGRLGGKKGGKARAAKLTAERRSEIARKAASARWAKRGEN